MNSRTLAFPAALALAVACTEPPLDIGSDAQFAMGENQGRAPFLASQVTAGRWHACALGVDGRTYCWGDNTEGQLGNGTNEASLTPVAVAGGHVFVDITTGGRNHTCGLTGDGEAWCWGENPFGQLGNGETTNSNVPVRAAPGLTFRTVDAGTYHTCGVAEDGTTYCWGSNGPLIQSANGATGWAFGTPTTTMCDNNFPMYRGEQWHCSLTPVAVPGPAFQSIDAGLWASCGLTGSGDAYCTGWNILWALGNGTEGVVQTMTPVSGGLSFDAVSLGVHGCGRVGTTAYCWGGRFFSFGQIGGGVLAGSSTPAPVAGGLSFASVHPTDANDIFTFTCGLTISDEAYCWGVNRFGGLGTEAPLEACGAGGQWLCSPVPVPVAGRNQFTSLATGQEFACGVGRNSAVYCWGANFAGQLGDGTQNHQPTPVAVLGPEPGNRGRRPAQPPRPTSSMAQ